MDEIFELLIDDKTRVGNQSSIAFPLSIISLQSWTEFLTQV